MAAPKPNNQNNALPSAKDHAATMNRMNLLLAKHQRTISAFKRSTPSSPSSSKNNAPSQSSSTSQKPKSSFSALSGRSTPTTADNVTSSSFKKDKHTHATTSSRLDDDDLDVIPDGAGVGYVPPGKEGGAAGAIDTSASAKATRDLRGKLLGKRAREQKEEAAAAAAAKRKRKLGAESESDEEEGRSKIGKKRGAGKR
ncbi:hypothetical protein BD289DRAFT_245410 [Coniella lustricola]|uniref:Uncharacterized protein n=1 Tax=Coniella lustricola TaxID=2025994 RepID=A0A2T3A928_9PEZI|nr:hypothetical protein BD289DRAFT_245410 [Coniella lustricola]